MKFLLAQINPVVGDLEGNAKKILYAASKASSTSADLVLTPELSLWGYPANDLLLKNSLIKNKNFYIDTLVIKNKLLNIDNLYHHQQLDKPKHWRNLYVFSHHYQRGIF